jgi:hypothetical protein
MHEEMLYMRTRESEMRDANETLNSRLWQSSLATVLVIALAAAANLRFLKRFFETEKVIS